MFISAFLGDKTLLTEPVMSLILFFISSDHSNAMCLSPCNGNDTSSECMWCSDANADVVFRPCMHRIACVPCSVRTKKCIVCHAVITAKVGPGEFVN